MMKKITFMLTILFSLVLTNAFAQGSCATAVPLTPGTQQCGDTSSGADVYDNNSCLGSYDGGDDYIFSYVASATGETLTLDLTGVAGWTGFAMSDDCPDVAHNCFGSATTTSAGDINFTSDPLTAGVTYYIHISTWPSPQNTAFCLDAVVNPAPTCIDPDTFVASNITTNTVDLSWNDPSGVQFDFEYVVQAAGVGTPAGSGVAVGATSATGISTELDTTPLAPATDYEAWVRVDCGGGDYSAWVGPIYFTTLCTTTVAPFLESFETPALPACWTQGGDNTWEYGSLGGGTPAPNFADYGANGVADHSISGTGTFIGMDGSDNGDGEVSTLTSPMIDVSGLTTPYLSYYVFSNNVDDAAQNELLVEFYDGSAWTTVETIQANLGTDWVMYGVDLTTFTITGDVQVRFTVTGVANGGSTYYNDILIDDVSIDEAPTCFAPTGLTVSNVTTNTADLTWTDGSGGVQFDFYYVIQPQGTGTAGITVENYYDYSSGVPFTATCTDISDCANTLLTPNTAYEVYVRDDCGGAWVGPVNFTTLCDVYTVPSLEDFTTYVPSCWEEADNGDLTAGPATFGTSSWVADGFANDGTTGAARIEIWQATLNDWILSPTYAIPATGYELKFNAAVTQWNTTAAPTNPWEADDVVEVLISTTGTTNWTVLYTYNDGNVPSNTGDINIIDLDAYAGQNVRFAFRVLEGAANGSADLNFYFDDFEVRMTPSCVEPDTFAASNVTTNTVDLSWNDPSGVQFDFEYVVQASGVGTPAGSGVAVGATSATGISTEVDTTPLAPATDYEAWVRADCGGGDYSAWVGPLNFSTNIEVICGTPVNTTYCYTDNDSTSWTFTSSDGSPLRVVFNAGQVENTWDELIVIDSDGVTQLYNGYGAAGNLAGLTFDATGDTITVMISSDGSGNCGGSGYTPWDFDVACATCVNPTVNFTVVEDCGNSQFSIDVDVTDLGTATSVTITDGTTTLTNISATGVQSFGPYPVGTPISIDVNNEQDASCFVTSGSLVDACPAVNDDCANAIQVSCGGTYTGDTTLATDSGSNTSADVWYYYDGAAGDITASLCTNTSFDTMIRIFDACGGAEIISNDDACSTQSEVTFTANGTSTYYIMVEGFGTNEGAFELNVSCVLSENSFDSNSFAAYPNPVKNVLTLEYSNEISSVSVFNMLGQEVLSRTIDATSTQIDMSQLNAGTYLVNVTSGDIQKTIKVVKQ